MTVRAFIACPGLGHVRRGYEAFATELHEALEPDPRLDVRLFSGADAPGTTRVPCLRRAGPAARPFARLAGGRGRYVAEQLSFAAGLVPYLRRHRPQVVLTSDWHLARALLRLRRRLGFRVVFSNGGPVPPALQHGFDHVHQVAPPHLEAALRHGIPAERQTLIPYGLALPGAVAPPAERPVLLSVGALEDDHKRMGYVVAEVARLPPGERPHLMLLGQRTGQTPAIERLAAERLGRGAYTVATAPPAEVGRAYDEASAVVLASLQEGFGRVLVEAAGRGVPTLAHDHPVARWILGQAHVADLREEGALATALPRALTAPRDHVLAAAMRRRFGWDALAPAYADLLVRVARS